MTFHSKTDLHYVHVIPPEWGPSVDIRASYAEFSQRNPFSSVISPSEFLNIKENSACYHDPRYMFILWDFMLDPGLKEHRKAIVVAVYSEAIGDTDKMLVDHVSVFNRFSVFCKNFDAILAHTPWMASALQNLTGIHSIVFPAGWSPAAMGVPRWDTPKHKDLVFYGSIAGRRQPLIPFFKEKSGLQVLEGLFGRQLIGALDLAKASLYIAHSNVKSFSTWRTWQTICTSAALIAEPADCWPLTPDHYIQIPTIELNNIDSIVSLITILFRSTDFLGFAKRMHEEIGPNFTIDKCVSDWLIPASEAILCSKS